MQNEIALKVLVCMALLCGTPTSTNRVAVKPRIESCPVIKIVCSRKEACRDPNYTFAVNIAGGYMDREPSYKWKVSTGTITSGQGTSEITVSDREGTDKSLTVSVEIGNIIPEGCPATESCTVQRGQLSGTSAKTQPCE